MQSLFSPPKKKSSKVKVFNSYWGFVQSLVSVVFKRNLMIVIDTSCIQEKFQFRKCNKEVYHLRRDGFKRK